MTGAPRRYMRTLIRQGARFGISGPRYTLLAVSASAERTPLERSRGWRCLFYLCYDSGSVTIPQSVADDSLRGGLEPASVTKAADKYH